MHVFATARAVAPIIAALALALAAPAGATVTTTRVTEPADGSFALVGWTETITVRGTSDGTTGDAVTLICQLPLGTYYPITGALDRPVAADGSWSASLRGWELVRGSCVYRAIPRATWPSQEALAAFAGTNPRGFADHAELDSDGRTWTWWSYARHSRAANEYKAFEDCGVCGMGFAAFDALRPEVLGWNAGVAKPAVGGRASISVDGRQAVGPHYAHLLNEDATGLPSTGLSVTSSGADDVTVNASSPLVSCPTDAVPLDTTICPSFATTGVRLDRQTRTRAGGRVVEIVDELVSTDGRPHEVVIDWDQKAGAVRFPGETAFAARTLGDRPAVDAAPGRSIHVILDPEAAPGATNPVGAMTLDQPWSDVLVKAGNVFTHTTRHAVPAGGVARLRWQFVVGESLAEVDEHVRAAEERFLPPAPPAPAPVNGGSAATPASGQPGAPGEPVPSPAPAPGPAPARPIVTASATQDFARTGAVVVTARCAGAPCTLDASGTVSVPGAAGVHRLATVRRLGDARRAVKLHLKLARSSRAAVHRALRRGARVTATVSVVARAADGRASRAARVRVRAKSRRR